MNPEDRKCEFCGKQANPKEHYPMLFDDLFRQTPKEVWDQYRAEGYTLHEAIKMERSYG